MARKTPIHTGYTVLNGSGTGTNGGRIDVWVEYALGSQSIAGNYTPVTAYFYAALNPAYTSSTYGSRGLNSSFSVNGTAGSGVSAGSYDFRATDRVNLLGSFSGNIPHNSDGTKTVRFVGSFTTQSSYISGGSIDASVTLPTIPRASSVSATDACITGVSRVTVSRRATGFSHSVRWAFGDLSGYLDGSGNRVDTETVFTAENLEFSIPEHFYQQIPNAPNGKCVLTCVTYQGNTKIGSGSCEMTISANPALCAPDLEAQAEDCNPATLALTGDAGVLVAGQSDARCSCRAEAKNGATLTAVTAAGVPVEDGCVLEHFNGDQVVFVATDSRGFTATRTVQFPVVAYVPVTCNASIRRTDPTSGNAVLTLSGRCFAGSFGAADNALTVTVATGEQTLTVAPPVGIDHHYQVTVTLSGLDYTQSHRVTLSAADALTGAEVVLTVPKGEPIFEWGERDFRFHVPASGDFLGSFQGVHLRTQYVGGVDRLQLQSRFSQYGEGQTSRQSIFLFGSCNGIALHGLLTINGLGGASWSGTEGIAASVASGGQVQLTLPRVAWDTFTALSSDAFEFI